MGHQSIIFGRIVINNNWIKASEVIQSLGNDSYLKQEMFGHGYPILSYYENPVISFGVCTKSIEDCLTDIIMEFENILKKIDFDTAKIQLETELTGTYNFFWKSKKLKNVIFDPEDKLIEAEDWYFGFGNRSLWGTLESDLLPEQIFTLNNFEYPLKSIK